jgi:hypothetical protein
LQDCLFYNLIVPLFSFQLLFLIEIFFILNIYLDLLIFYFYSYNLNLFLVFPVIIIYLLSTSSPFLFTHFIVLLLNQLLNNIKIYFQFCPFKKKILSITPRLDLTLSYLIDNVDLCLRRLIISFCFVCNIQKEK